MTLLKLTLARVPENVAAKDSAGLPWGCLVQPLNDIRAIESDKYDVPLAGEVARCSSCFAYINSYCVIEKRKWFCCLCGATNDLTERYEGAKNKELLYELSKHAIELTSDTLAVPEFNKNVANHPVYIALVHTSASEEFVDTVKNGLLGMLEALPKTALFALCTVDEYLGIYHIDEGSNPHLYTIELPKADEDIEVPLDDILPLAAMAVPIGTHKSGIIAAIESLHSTSTLEADNPAAATRPKHFALGPALNALWELLSSVTEDPYLFARMMLFIGGAPNMGVGTIKEPVASDGNVLTETKGKPKPLHGSAHYQHLASKCADLNLAVDIYAVAEHAFCGLEALKDLSAVSGGYVIYYDSPELATLPQDLFRIMSKPHACKGLLRIRCSSGFGVGKAFGHLHADERFENLYHVVTCDQSRTYGFDFEFTSASGVGSRPDLNPTVQLAFSYDCVVDSQENDESGSNFKIGHKVQTRLRLETYKLEVARSPTDIFPFVEPEATIALVLHKIIAASQEEGLQEARMLLQDWLVILAARYNQYMNYGYAKSQLDVSFSRYQNLELIPRLIFALLRGPLLDPVMISRDQRVFLQFLFCSVNASVLRSVVYPCLSAWEDENTVVEGSLPLSVAAIEQSQQKIFVLDSFTDIFVYYTRNAQAQLQYPPPQDCKLRSDIQQLKRERLLTPRVIFCRQGNPDCKDFLARMVEDPLALSNPASQSKDWTGAAANGFTRFLEFLRAEAQGFLQQ